MVSPVYILKSLLEPRTRPSDASLEVQEKRRRRRKRRRMRISFCKCSIGHASIPTRGGGIRRRPLRGVTIVALTLLVHKALLRLYTPLRGVTIVALTLLVHKALLRLYTPLRGVTIVALELRMRP